MFPTTTAFYPTFNIESHLTNGPLECYKARAQTLRRRFPWSKELEPVFNAYLIHLSANVPGKVAYYATVDNMVANRLTRTSPEMFFDRTLKQAPDEIRAAWSTEVLGKTLPHIEFIENTDADGWAHVYNVGPHSCMAGSEIVRVYAYPKNNLALAYLRNEDGLITHRAIVNKDRKTYLRAYGKEDQMPFFIAALNKLDYDQDSETLHGELLQKWPVKCRECGETQSYQGPYLDGTSGYFKVSEHNDDAVVVSSSGYDPYDGEDADDYYCGCKEHYDDDNDDDED
jgi:hypothetical protein